MFGSVKFGPVVCVPGTHTTGPTVKVAAEDLDVILYSNVEFRKIQYIEDCKTVSKPLLVCYKFLARFG